MFKYSCSNPLITLDFSREMVTIKSVNLRRWSDKCDTIIRISLHFTKISRCAHIARRRFHPSQKG